VVGWIRCSWRARQGIRRRGLGVLVRLAPQPRLPPPPVHNCAPPPLRTGLAPFTHPAPNHHFRNSRSGAERLSHRLSVPVYGRCPHLPAMAASPPSLHPHYQASSVLRSDPTSRTPFALLASSARTGILPRGRAAWISLVTVMTARQARTGLRPRVPPRRSPPRDAGCCLRPCT